MKNTAKVLSHIILIVNKTVSKEDLSSFCTNIRSENPGTELTYLCYDNLTPCSADDLSVKLTNSLQKGTDQLFMITDSGEAAQFSEDNDIACAALGSGDDPRLRKLLYCIEDIGFMTFERINRMWQRHHGIPWIITETDRLIIREQVLSDIDGLYEIYDDDETRRYVEDLYEDRKAEEKYLRDYIDNQYRFHEYGLWALTLKDTGELIGRAGIGIREGYDIPELGYVIGKKYRRKGYAGEALRAIISYGSGELGLDEYMAFTSPKNTPSVRLLEKLGFSRSGKDVIMGREHDMYLLTLGQ